MADRQHLHHRFEAVGFSQRRAVLYLYGWCLSLTLAALATNFVHPHPHGEWDWTNVAIDAAVAALAIGASVYIVYLLEIVKLANPFIRRREELARAEQPQDRVARGCSHDLRQSRAICAQSSDLRCHIVRDPSAVSLRYAPAPMEPAERRAFPPAEAGALLIVVTARRDRREHADRLARRRRSRPG